MATVYPGAIDALNNPTPANNLDTASVIHDQQHSNVNDAVEAIETELGINPKGAALSVRARLDAIDTAMTARALSADEGAANGIATLDGTGKLVQNLDAGKVNSGAFDVARIPNHSGAKILGTGGGGAAIPVDAVPNLDAGKTTTGVFALARLPNIPASLMTSGVLDAARIPTTVTANANAKIVADVAARDAIPILSRVDGMMVWTSTTNQMWVWETTGATWNLVGGAAETEVNIATWLASGITTFSASYPFHGMYNANSKRFTLEAVFSRSSNSASAILHPLVNVPSQYQPVGSINAIGASPNNIGGGAEKVSRFTGAATMSCILGASAIFATGQFCMVNVSWITP